MIRIFCLIGLLACVVGESFAQSRDYPPQFADAQPHAYKTVGDVELKLWVVSPTDQPTDEARPAIIFFFGGGWKQGSPGQFEQHCRYLAARGMVAITADYRVRTRHNTLADQCVADAKSAIRWVRQHADELGVDPERIVAAGGSAGGHLAACTAVIAGLDDPSEDTTISSVPNAVALFNPAVVLADYEGLDLDPQRLADLKSRTGVEPKQISPIHHLRAGQPPTIIFHGEADETVPYATVAAFSKAAVEVGNRCELKGYPGAGHGFFNFGRGGTPGTYYRQTLIALDEFLSSLGYLSGEPTLDTVDRPSEQAAEPTAAVSADPEARPPIVVSDRARQIHASAPVIDGHNDLPWAIRVGDRPFDTIDLYQPQPQFHTDIPRLQSGGVGAQFWSVYVPVSTQENDRALSTTLEQIALVRQFAEHYPDVFQIALTAQDIERIRSSGRIASLIGVEGGHAIEDSIGALRQLYHQGARYMTLTHSQSLAWADSCSDVSRCGGLGEFGREVVREMNRLGMLVDLSHVSPECMRAALTVTTAPVIFSHSSARAVADHPRNVPDDVLSELTDNGGIVMINFFDSYVEPVAAQRSVRRDEVRQALASTHTDDPDRASAKLRKWERAHPAPQLCDAHHVLDHIEHVIQIAGVDHVGLGSDFDGVPSLPRQLEDVSTYPVITQGLLDRGYSENEIRKVLGENLLRVFKEVEQVASGSTGSSPTDSETVAGDANGLGPRQEHESARN